MFEALARRAERAGEIAAERAAERLAARLNAGVPGVTAEAERGGVVLRGRGLARRELEDARLRWIGGWLK